MLKKYSTFFLCGLLFAISFVSIHVHERSLVHSEQHHITEQKQLQSTENCTLCDFKVSYQFESLNLDFAYSFRYPTHQLFSTSSHDHFIQNTFLFRSLRAPPLA